MRMVPPSLRLLLFIAFSLVPVCSAAEVPDPGIAQVVEVTGSAVFAPDRNTMMRYGGEGRLDEPGIQLHSGQWLHAGQVVMTQKNSSLRLRWRDGHESQLGPRTIPLLTIIEAPAKAPHIEPPGVLDRALEQAQPVLDFERTHRPLLVFGFGALLALLPLLRRRRYRPGAGARIAAGVMLIVLTAPISLLIIAGSILGRMSWLQLPLPGRAFTGIAADVALFANVAAFCVMLAGLFALWLLTLAFITGGSARLDRRGAAWWWLACAAVACATLAFLAPYAPNLDLESPWHRFWTDWARYYSRGAWLLLPLALLIACARSTTTQAIPRVRWQGAAASGVAIVFLACYSIGYAHRYESYMPGAQRSDTSSRMRARKLACAADQVFEGTPGNFRVVTETGCTSAPVRRPGNFNGVLHRCETALVDVRIDKILRAPQLAVGQTVEFRIDARLNVDDLRETFSDGRMRFFTREEQSQGTTYYVSENRLKPGYEHLDVGSDSRYTLGLLAQCPR